MGAGISVRNESSLSILVIASQLSPLYWGKCDPGETWNAKNEKKMGKVWFTISVGAYQAGAEPTVAGVAARLTAITATTLLTGGIIGVGLVGGASGLTSSLGVKRDGVYADCRCLVVRSVCHDDGCIELYFAVEETLDEKTGAVKSSKTLMMAPEPRVTVKGAVAPPVTVFNSSSAIPVAHALDTYTLQVDCASQDNQLAEVSIVNQLRHPTDRIVDMRCTKRLSKSGGGTKLGDRYGMAEDRTGIWCKKGFRGNFEVDVQAKN